MFFKGLIIKERIFLKDFYELKITRKRCYWRINQLWCDAIRTLWTCGDSSRSPTVVSTFSSIIIIISKQLLKRVDKTWSALSMTRMIRIGKLNDFNPSSKVSKKTVRKKFNKFGVCVNLEIKNDVFLI